MSIKSSSCRAIPHWVALFTLAACTTEPAVSEAESDLTTASYRGWNRFTGACNVDTALEVHEPTVAGRYPLFIYAVGTGALVSSAEGQLAAKEMAKRGFVSAVLQYDATALSGISCPAMQAKASCAYAGWRTYSAVSVLCRRGKADCSRGIVVAGLSQGAAMAVLGGNVDARIRAAYLTGFGGGAAGTATACYVDGQTRLPGARLRVINGREWQPIANLNAATGMSCGGLAASCLRANGSGWYRVSHDQVEDGNADHCYMIGPDSAGNEVGCTRNPPGFDVGWAPPASAPWSLDTNLDWLAQFAD